MVTGVERGMQMSETHTLNPTQVTRLGQAHIDLIKLVVLGRPTHLRFQGSPCGAVRGAILMRSVRAFVPWVLVFNLKRKFCRGWGIDRMLLLGARPNGLLRSSRSFSLPPRMIPVAPDLQRKQHISVFYLHTQANARLNTMTLLQTSMSIKLRTSKLLEGIHIDQRGENCGW